MLSPLACSREALARLFQNAASTLELIFLFSYILSILLSKISSSIFSSAPRQQLYEYEDEYEEEDIMFSQEFGDTTQELAMETEDGQEIESFGYDSDGSYGGEGSMICERDHLVADVVDGGETLMFISNTGIGHDVNRNSFDDGYSDFEEEAEYFEVGCDDRQGEEYGEIRTVEEAEYFEVGCDDRQREEYREIRTVEEIGVASRKNAEKDVVIVKDITGREDCYLDDDDEDDEEHEEPLVRRKPAVVVDLSKKDHVFMAGNNINASQDTRASNYGTTTVVTEPEIKQECEITELAKEETGENTLIHEPPKTDNRKLKAVVINTHETNYHSQHMITEINEEKEELFSESCTNGSTSKSSSDWRSSFTCTNDPFTSSSSRSCAKWESYTVFQKYDEEMMLLDRISAQKLQERESLKYFQVQPKSISYKIIHTVLPKTQSDHLNIYSNSAYFELESTYVAQICLAWEALSWDYDTFKRKQDRLKRPPYNNDDDEDQGCPAHIAQQFQQFQVLLQRYIENEPYERGRRPELYARMRRVANKLLQVPEYHDYDNERLKEVENSRVPTSSFQSILEESIRTFMNFLKADRENRCQAMFEALLRRSRRGKGSNIDPNVLKTMKKENKKKKLKLKQMQRASRSICFGKLKVTKGEEMEILMGLIDLKVVSRVLRMGGGGHLLTQEQVRWCESKMAKVVLSDGRLKRDSSSPLFFPAH